MFPHLPRWAQGNTPLYHSHIAHTAAPLLNKHLHHHFINTIPVTTCNNYFQGFKRCLGSATTSEEKYENRPCSSSNSSSPSIPAVPRSTCALLKKLQGHSNRFLQHKPMEIGLANAEIEVYTCTLPEDGIKCCHLFCRFKEYCIQCQFTTSLRKSLKCQLWSTLVCQKCWSIH